MDAPPAVDVLTDSGDDEPSERAKKMVKRPAAMTRPAMSTQPVGTEDGQTVQQEDIVEAEGGKSDKPKGATMETSIDKVPDGAEKAAKTDYRVMMYKTRGVGAIRDHISGSQVLSVSIPSAPIEKVEEIIQTALNEIKSGVSIVDAKLLTNKMKESLLKKLKSSE